MADSERREIRPEDLPELLEAFRRSIQRDAVGRPIVDDPPALRFPDDMLRLRVREEVGHVIDEKLRPVFDLLAHFLKAEQIDDKIAERFEAIGLPIDTAQAREKTGESVRSIVKWQQRADKVSGGIALSIMMAIVYAALKLVGVHLPSAPGDG